MISFGKWRRNDAARARKIIQAAIAKLPPHVQAEITATLRDQDPPTVTRAATAPAYLFVVRAGKTRTFNAIREVAWARPDLLGVTFDRRWMGERRRQPRAGPVERRTTERRSAEVDREWARRGFVLSTLVGVRVGVSTPDDIRQTREVRRDGLHVHRCGSCEVVWRHEVPCLEPELTGCPQCVAAAADAVVVSAPGISAPGPAVIVPAASVSPLVDAAPVSRDMSHAPMEPVAARVDAVGGSDAWRSPLPGLAVAVGESAHAATLSGEVTATLLEGVSVTESMELAAENLLIARPEVATAAEEVVEPIAAAIAPSEVATPADDVAEPIAAAVARSEVATAAEEVVEPIAAAIAPSDVATAAEDIVEPITAAVARSEVATPTEEVIEPIAAAIAPSDVATAAEAVAEPIAAAVARSEVATPAEEVVEPIVAAIAPPEAASPTDGRVEPIAAAVAPLEAAAWMDEALADAVDGRSEQVSSASGPDEGFPEPEDVEPAAVEASALLLEAEFVADEMASASPDASFAAIEAGATLAETFVEPDRAERAPTEPTLALDEAAIEPVVLAAAADWSLADLGAATSEPVPDPSEVLAVPVDVEPAPSALAVTELAPAAALDDATLERVTLTPPAVMMAADLGAATAERVSDPSEVLAVPVDVEPAPSALAVTELAPAAALDDAGLERVTLAPPAVVMAADLGAATAERVSDLGEVLAAPVDVEPAPSALAVTELAPAVALDDAAPELVALASSAVVTAADPIEVGSEPVGSVPGPWEGLAASSIDAQPADADPAPAEAATALVGTESAVDEVEAPTAELVAAATAPIAAAAPVEITAPPAESVAVPAAAAIGSVETASTPGADVPESEAQAVPSAAAGARLGRAGKAKPRSHVHRCGRCGHESRHEGFCVVPTVTDRLQCPVCDVARSRRPRARRAVAAAIAGLALLPALWWLHAVPWPSGRLVSLRAPHDPGPGRPAPSPEAPTGATVKPSRETAEPEAPAAQHRPPLERAAPPGSETARLDSESRPAPAPPPAVSAGRAAPPPPAARKEPGASSLTAVPPPPPKPGLPRRAPPSDSRLAEAGRVSSGPPSGSGSSGVAPLESGAPPASPTVARPTPGPSDRPQAPHSAPAPVPGSAIATAQPPPSGYQSPAPPPEKVPSDVGIRGAPPPGSPGGSFAMLASAQGIRVSAGVPGRQPGLADGPTPSVVRSPRVGRRARDGPDPRHHRRGGPLGVRRGRAAPGAARGLGFLVDGRGYVLTHSDVIRDGKGLEAALADGRTFAVKQVWRDPLAGVAVLWIDGRDLPALPLGDSTGLRVGDATALVGWPTASAPPSVSATIRATGSDGRQSRDRRADPDGGCRRSPDQCPRPGRRHRVRRRPLHGRALARLCGADRPRQVHAPPGAGLAAPARPGFTSGR